MPQYFCRSFICNNYHLFLLKFSCPDSEVCCPDWNKRRLRWHQEQSVSVTNQQGPHKSIMRFLVGLKCWEDVTFFNHFFHKPFAWYTTPNSTIFYFGLGKLSFLWYWILFTAFLKSSVEWCLNSTRQAQNVLCHVYNLLPQHTQDMHQFELSFWRMEVRVTCSWLKLGTRNEILSWGA